jgi:hypothetical protein
MQSVNWKDVAGFEGYYKVSDVGQVSSIERREDVFCTVTGERKYTRTRKGRLLVPQTDSCHNQIVTLYKGNKTVVRTVGSLVLETFKRPAVGEEKAYHLNKNRRDNRLVNLIWMTPSDWHKYVCNMMTPQEVREHGTTNPALIKLNGKTIVEWSKIWGVPYHEAFQRLREELGR